jgi:hypothetical protein
MPRIVLNITENPSAEFKVGYEYADKIITEEVRNVGGTVTDRGFNDNGRYMNIEVPSAVEFFKRDNMTLLLSTFAINPLRFG